MASRGCCRRVFKPSPPAREPQVVLGCNQKSNIKITHLNVQGLRKKVAELEVWLKVESPDYFCISEHWASNDEIEYLKLDGYILCHSFCRSQYARGGVSIYSKVPLASGLTQIELSCCEKTFESCCIKNVKQKFVIVCVYRSPDSDVGEFVYYFEQMVTVLFKHLNYKIFILGDFNIDIFSSDVRRRMFGQIIENYNMRLLISEATRVTALSTISTCQYYQLALITLL